MQSIQDSGLRPEFVEQMTQLRQKIFKKVKPKVLNGRFITGEMLLELCVAYTGAINKGSVPCIESAWSYICQNETQRAVKESLDLVDKHLASRLIMKKDDEVLDEPALKEFWKPIKLAALKHFSSKAVGSDFKTVE